MDRRISEKDNYSDENWKDGFSLGNLDRGLDDKAENIEEKKVKSPNQRPPKKELKNRGSNFANPKSSLQKRAFFALLTAAALISAYYIYKTFEPKNYHIKTFNLKMMMYKSKILPGNNLLIRGYLSNNNKYPISFVKLRCRLYSSKNIILVTKHVYAGNFINMKKLKNMSNVAINAALQNRLGKDMSDVEILPQHPVKFMVVFFNVPSNIKNYSIAVSHFFRINTRENITPGETKT